MGQGSRIKESESRGTTSDDPTRAVREEPKVREGPLHRISEHGDESRIRLHGTKELWREEATGPNASIHKIGRCVAHDLVFLQELLEVVVIVLAVVRPDDVLCFLPGKQHLG